MLIVAYFRSFDEHNQFIPKISFSNRGCAQFSINAKGPGTSFQATPFAEFFDNTFSFAVFHKLAKCYFQTMFMSKDIQ